MQALCFRKASALLAICAAALGTAAAEIPRVLPAGELPRDRRLEPLKDLDGYFPFTPSPNRAEWLPRAERVRRRILVSQGLWPEPTRTPLNAVVHGRIESGDYTVEKVFFESMPGLFVTGNLYRPAAAPAPGEKRPGVLCAHGHWEESRFRILRDAELKKELESGGERLPSGGRSIYQSLGVQLARMGCVAFVYDMLGYCDAKQLGFDLVHKFAKQRPEMNSRENWGLFSPQAELHAQSVMGLQTWNSVRALDFLTSLPVVDPQRLGCTGASGGGTQTMLLAAIDPRLGVACPAVMVSTAMQGGCTCENASLLRVETGNVEFAAVFAPKPMGMTAANDWTKEMGTKGFPELRRHWAMMDAPQSVALWPLLRFPHNFNNPSREHFYAWFNTHFGLGLDDARCREREYTLRTREELTVWNERHPAPPGGPDFERKLLRWWHDDAQRQLAAAAKSADEFQRIHRAAWETIVGRTFAGTGEVKWEARGPAETIDGGSVSRGVLRGERDGAELPALIVRKTADAPGPLAIWLHDDGKAGLFEDGGLRSEVRDLVERGFAVLGIDLFMQGEFLADGKPLERTRRVKNPREAAAYTFGYNHALFAQRVHDVLAGIRFARGSEERPQNVALVARGNVAAIAAAARALADGEVERAVIEPGDFRFADVADVHDPNFLPGAAKYGDIDALLALGLRGEVFILHRGAELAPMIPECYRLAGASNRLRAAPASEDARRDALRWLGEMPPVPLPLIAP